MADAHAEDEFAQVLASMASCRAGVEALAGDSNADVLPVERAPFFRTPTPPPARPSLALQPKMP